MRSIQTFISSVLAVFTIILLVSCGGSTKVQAKDPAGSEPANSNANSVGIVKVARKNLERTLTVSSELVPFQEIDVFAKEAGFVKEINVDYGSHVKKDQVLAVLEIPELQLQLKQDDAVIKNASDMIDHAQHELNRVEAQQKVFQLQFDRLNGVSKSKPGLVAQQEVDDAEGRALSSAANVEASKANLQSAQSKLADAQAKKEHDQALFDYAKITAPFAGVVTQRYANLGALMQSGINSSTQATPLVKLSEDDLFRLVIPVPESYVHYIHLGDPVSVNVPSLNRSFPGRVARFSVDVQQDTRTMHTEVDVPNPARVLLPGLFAEATIVLERRNDAVAVPVQALDQVNGQATVDIVDASNKIEQRRIVTGIQTPADAEVISGLAEGESVVVSDRSGLRAGQSVQPRTIDLIQYQSPDEQH